MLDRLEFLKRVLGGSLAALLLPWQELGGVELPERYDAYACDSFTDLANSVIEPNSGGLRVRKAWIETLKPTCDAKKFVVHAVDEDGHHYEKVVMLSGVFMLTSDEVGRRSEMAYQVTKLLGEIAYDMAARKWGPGWRKKVYRRDLQFTVPGS